MHRLVCSGQVRPGQTGWSAIDAMALDVAIDFAYAELVAEFGAESKDELDHRLDSLDGMSGDEENLVPVERPDGTVTYITEGRRAQIRRNLGLNDDNWR